MPVFSLMFNGFAYPFQRHSFVFMPLFALILARTLDDMIIRKQMSRLLLCLTALFCAAVIIDRLRKLSNWPVSDGQKAMLTLTFSVMLACLAILFCCLFTSSYEVPKGLRNSLCIALVLAVGVSLFADNYRTVSNRETIKKDSLEMEELFGEDIQQALSYIQEQDASFYRVDKSHSKEIGGTGLGLSIVKHGAAYLGAKVELDSQLDKGSVFRLIWGKNSSLS